MPNYYTADQSDKITSTEAEWAESNRILVNGDIGHETDTLSEKTGDGVTRWNDLPYSSGPKMLAAQLSTPGTPTFDALRTETYGAVAPQTKVPRQPVTYLSTFPNGHGWVAGGTGVTSADDTADPFLGDRSVILTAPTSGTTYVSKTLTGPVNLTNKQIVLWVKPTDLSRIESVQVFLGESASFAAYYYLSAWNPGSATKPTVSGRWTPIRLCLDDKVGATTANLADVNALRIRLQARSTGSAEIRLGGIGYVSPHPAFPTGVVSFTFDDGIDDQFTAGRRILDKYGMPGTLYTIVGRLDLPGHMTTQQVRDLHSRSGWEIAGHAYSDAVHSAQYINIPAAEADADLLQLKKWLIAEGFGSESFCYPQGDFNAEVAGLVSKYFSSARTTSGEPAWNMLPPMDPMYLTDFEVNSLSACQLRVDATAAHKFWTIFTIHHVGVGGVSEADFEALVDYVKASGVEVLTVGEVVRRCAARA